jgi:predicted enzyme related to lactoylglutathione lyase
MATIMSLTGAYEAAPGQIGPVAPALPSVPTARSVPSLDAAMREIRQRGGTITSDTRTAPGIGTWAFVADAAGVEIVLWEDAPATGT